MVKRLPGAGRPDSRDVMSRNVAAGGNAMVDSPPDGLSHLRLDQTVQATWNKIASVAEFARGKMEKSGTFFPEIFFPPFQA